MRKVFITLIIFVGLNLVLSVASLLFLSALGYLEDDTTYLEVSGAEVSFKQGQKYNIFLCSAGHTPPAISLAPELAIREKGSQKPFPGDLINVAGMSYVSGSPKGTISGVRIGCFQPAHTGVAVMHFSPPVSNVFLGVQTDGYGDFILTFCVSVLVLVLAGLFTACLSRTQFVRKFCHHNEGVP